MNGSLSRPHLTFLKNSTACTCKAPQIVHIKKKKTLPTPRCTSPVFKCLPKSPCVRAPLEGVITLGSGAQSWDQVCGGWTLGPQPFLFLCFASWLPQDEALNTGSKKATGPATRTLPSWNQGKPFSFIICLSQEFCYSTVKPTNTILEIYTMKIKLTFYNSFRFTGTGKDAQCSQNHHT